MARGLFLYWGILGTLLMSACSSGGGSDSATEPEPPVSMPPEEEEEPPVNPTDAEITLPGGEVFESLGAAVAAADPGDVLELGPGTYREIVVIDKALTLISTDGPATTILEGERRFRPIEVRGAAVTLEGLTFLHAASDPGGAIGSHNAQLTVRDCIFAECSSPDRAGAVAVLTDSEASAVFENCIFRDNSSLGRGGAIFAAAGNGDQRVSIHCRECRFLRNDGNAGGVVLLSAGADQAQVFADFDRCRFESNSGRDGGAILMEVATGEARGILRLRGCLFVENAGTGQGGALRMVALTGNASVDALVLQCTFTRNHNPSRAGNYGTISAEAPTEASQLRIHNSILFDNAPRGIDPDRIPFEAKSSWIDRDPLFLAPVVEDFHLAPGSPAVDAGDSSLLTPDMLLDLDGRPRLLGAGVDVGAYELR